MTLNSGDEYTYPLEPGRSSVRSAFRQTLKVPLNLVEEDWEVALTSMIYPHTFGNAVLKDSDEAHALVRDPQGKVVQRVILSPYKQFSTRRDVIAELTSHWTVNNVWLTDASPALSTGATSLDLLGESVIDGWEKTKKALPSTAQEVVDYAAFALQTLKVASSWFDLVYQAPDTLQWNLRANTDYRLSTAFQSFFQLPESTASSKNQNVYTWNYTPSAKKVVAYQTDKSLYLSCHRGTITYHENLHSTFVDLLPHELVMPLSDVTVEVVTSRGQQRIVAWTKSELTTWVNHNAVLPFTKAHMVDFLRGLPSLKGFMEFAYDSSGLELILVGEARAVRHFRLSPAFRRFTQYRGAGDPFVPPRKRTSLRVAFNERRPCMVVVSLNRVLLWGLNGGTVKVKKDKARFLSPLASKIDVMPDFTDGVGVEYEEEGQGGVPLFLFDEPRIDAWVALHGVMPNNRNDLMGYLQEARRSWSPTHKSWWKVDAVTQQDALGDPTLSFSTGVKMTLGSSHGSFTFPAGFIAFTQYGGPGVVVLRSRYTWKYTPLSEAKVTVYQERQADRLLWCCHGGATLEVNHGLPEVLGFERLTNCVRIRVDDRPLTALTSTADSTKEKDLFVTLTWSSFIHDTNVVRFPDSHWNHTITSQEVVDEVFKNLTVLPDFLAGPAVRFKNEITGEEVDLDLFREDLLRRALDAHQGLLKGSEVAVYLNHAKSQLDAKARNVPLYFAASNHADHLELQLKGQCTYTLSEAMAEFVALEASPFSSRIITVQGNPSTSYSYDWHVYHSRYLGKSPVLAYRLGSAWFFSGVYGSMTPSPALQSLLPSVDYQKGTYWRAPDVYDVCVGGGKRGRSDVLGDTDLSHAYVEVDLAEPSIVGGRWRSLLATLALDPAHYGKTVTLHLAHVDYRPVVAPLQHVGEVRVYIRNGEDVTLPFYTGLVTLTLHFRRRRREP